ncbi:hypothetical protein BDR04DRAFT_575163 [Suillus decipiens]|nr:hypothetical protein BDR04DRAFT_575163 [Suillus decipiens]
MAGPFKFGDDYVGALRLSKDSRKSVMSNRGRCLEVWDVQAQKLDVQKSTPDIHTGPTAPIFWTTQSKSIVAAFTFMDDYPTTIYEFDASTLQTVGAPFKDTFPIDGLALSSDCVLLASSSYHDTIKLWSFESRQLLASFDVKSLFTPHSLARLASTCLHDLG